MCEAVQSDNVAVANQFLDRLFEWSNVRQTVIMPRWAACLTFFAALLIVPLLRAHHSTAEYDLTHPATATGIVIRFDWINPHARILLDETKDDGTVEHWIIEIDSPNALQRHGWAKDSLKAGDKITCSGAGARDGSPRMRSTQVVLADGRELQSY